MHSTLLDSCIKTQGFTNDRKYQWTYNSLSRKVQHISIEQDNSESEVTVDVSPVNTGLEIIWKDFDSRVEALCGGSSLILTGILE